MSPQDTPLTPSLNATLAPPNPTMPEVVNAKGTKKGRNAQPVFPVEPRVIQVVKKPRTFMNHSYRDFSSVPPEVNEIVPKDISQMTFPQKVHHMLSQPEYSRYISWQPHGRAFCILLPKMFETEVCPKYLGHRRYSSFLRQLSNHSFKHITTGKDRNCYYHEFMLRGLPHLVKYMPRPKDARRLIPDPANEPDLYAISEAYPIGGQKVVPSERTHERFDFAEPGSMRRASDPAPNEDSLRVAKRPRTTALNSTAQSAQPVAQQPEAKAELVVTTCNATPSDSLTLATSLFAAMNGGNGAVSTPSTTSVASGAMAGAPVATTPSPQPPIATATTNDGLLNGIPPTLAAPQLQAMQPASQMQTFPQAQAQGQAQRQAQVADENALLLEAIKAGLATNIPGPQLHPPPPPPALAPSVPLVAPAPAPQALAPQDQGVADANAILLEALRIGLTHMSSSAQATAAPQASVPAPRPPAPRPPAPASAPIAPMAPAAPPPVDPLVPLAASLIQQATNNQGGGNGSEANTTVTSLALAVLLSGRL